MERTSPRKSLHPSVCKISVIKKKHNLFLSKYRLTLLSWWLRIKVRCHPLRSLRRFSNFCRTASCNQNVSAQNCIPQRTPTTNARWTELLDCLSLSLLPCRGALRVNLPTHCEPILLLYDTRFPSPPQTTPRPTVDSPARPPRACCDTQPASLAVLQFNHHHHARWRQQSPRHLVNMRPRRPLSDMATTTPWSAALALRRGSGGGECPLTNQLLNYIYSVSSGF